MTKSWIDTISPIFSPPASPMGGGESYTNRGRGAGNDWLSFLSTLQRDISPMQRFDQDFTPFSFRVPVPKINLVPPTTPAKSTTLPATKVTQSGTPSKTVQEWAPTVAPLAAQYGVPMDVALGIMDIESGGNPEAKSAMNYAGGKAIGQASGLMQIMPGNFAPGEDPMDPVTNISRGLKMLADRFKTYGNWESAAASYFGAIGKDGKPSSAADVNGVTGVAYVQRFSNARSKYASP